MQHEITGLETYFLLSLIISLSNKSGGNVQGDFRLKFYEFIT